MASSRNNTLEFSSAGSQILGSSDTATITNIGAIQCLNDTVFDTLTTSNIDTSLQVLAATGGSGAPTLPAGTVIYGKITAVKLHSGLVALHRV
jgi:hypothetical protein|tara:strand:+ start:1227 stop:1505 length:279 start_codon:yes stop_codon:yes gene_type:complete